jgi:hypothetical protein
MFLNLDNNTSKRTTLNVYSNIWIKRLKYKLKRWQIWHSYSFILECFRSCKIKRLFLLKLLPHVLQIHLNPQESVSSSWTSILCVLYPLIEINDLSQTTHAYTECFSLKCVSSNFTSLKERRQILQITADCCCWCFVSCSLLASYPNSKLSIKLQQKKSFNFTWTETFQYKTVWVSDLS